MKFTKEQYNLLSSFAFNIDNPGFNAKIIESPNGDGIWDNTKKYAHIAPKYFNQLNDDFLLKREVLNLYNKAISESFNICNKLGVPKKFWAGSDSTLRVLQYPPGSTTAPHKDFNLFTLCMYRDEENAFKYLSGENDTLLTRAKKISSGIHFGEIMTEINGSKATEHEVVATNNWQHSVVFFVVPNHNAILPSGMSVGSWILERKSRSRKIKNG